MEKEYQAQPGVPVPPPELVQQWLAEIWHEGTPVRVAQSDLHLAAQAARWGYRQAREDARRLEARELSAFGLLPQNP